MGIPEIMKAAILVEQQAPLVVEDVEIPADMAPGQVMVRVHYSGICGSQLGEIDGVKGPDPYLPHMLGHEGSGEVVKVGAGVTTVSVGDRVVLHWRRGTGIEAAPATYRSGRGVINAGRVTTFSEYTVVSENRITRCPHELGSDVAALFGCAVTTGFGAVMNNARLRIGESIVVYGAGGIGLNIVQAASMISAYPVIAVDLHDNRLALARQFGATHIVNGSAEDPQVAIRKILDQREPDVFIDNTGNPDIIAAGYAMTGPLGRVILVGVPGPDQHVTIHSLPLHFGKILTGSHGGDAEPETDIPRYSRLYRHGRLELKNLISGVYDLDSVNDAILDMRSGALAGRCLLKIGDPERKDA